MFWQIIITDKIDNETLNKIKQWLLQYSKYLKGCSKLVDDLLDNCMEASWSTYREDMIELSRAFPTLHFIAQGESEDCNDFDAVTREYYYNGKFEVAELQHIFTEPTIW